MYTPIILSVYSYSTEIFFQMYKLLMEVFHGQQTQSIYLKIKHEAFRKTSLHYQVITKVEKMSATMLNRSSQMCQLTKPLSTSASRSMLTRN